MSEGAITSAGGGESGGISVSVGDGDAGQGGQQQPGQGQPQEQGQQRAPARQRAPQRQERASIGDFSRFAGRPETMTQVDQVAEDLSDPMAGLIDRAVQGNAGQELANIDDEMAAVNAQSQRDARAANGEDEPEELQATLVEDDERVKGDARYEKWKKKAEQFDAFASGTLPAEAYANILVPHEFENGRKGSISIHDLKRGNLREADYHRKLRELYQLKAEYETAEQGIRQFVGAIVSGDPATFFAALNLIPGAMDSFRKAALVFGFQLDAERNMNPTERQLAAERRQLQAIAQRQQLEIQQLRENQQMVQQQQPGPDSQFIYNQLNQFIPLAAKRLAERGTPYVDTKLAQYFATPTWNDFLNAFRNDPQRQITLDDVTDVLASIMQQVNDHVASGGVQHVPVAAQQLPPVNRMAAAPSGAMARQAGAPTYGSANQAPRGSGANGRPDTRSRIGDIQHIARTGPR